MKTRSRLLLTTALLVLSSALPAAATTARHHPRTYLVSMKSFAFNPSAVTVHVGDSVRWTYDETATDVPPGCESPAFRTPAVSCPGHSATSAAVVHGHRLFDSGVHRANGFPFTFRFTRPGTYAYYCTVHGGAHPNNPVTSMNGQVTVRP